MQIFVAMIGGGGRKLTLEVERTDTVEELREKIHAAGGPKARPELQVAILLEDGEKLKDGHDLDHYDVGMEAELRVALRPPPPTVWLNVGGSVYTTQLSTLLAVEGSGLFQMFDPNGLRRGAGRPARRAERRGARNRGCHAWANAPGKSRHT